MNLRKKSSCRLLRANGIVDGRPAVCRWIVNTLSGKVMRRLPCIYLD